MNNTRSTTGTPTNHDTVRAVYADVLSAPAKTTEARYYELFSPDVVSIPTPPAGPGAQGMLNTIAWLGHHWSGALPGARSRARR